MHLLKIFEHQGTKIGILKVNTLFRKATLFFLLLIFNFCNLKAQDSLLLKSGTFAIGVNYWASYAGTHMWRDWK